MSRAEVRVTLTTEEARHVAECLEISAESNGGNDHTAPDGRTWETYTEDLHRRWNAAALLVGLAVGEAVPEPAEARVTLTLNEDERALLIAGLEEFTEIGGASPEVAEDKARVRAALALLKRAQQLPVPVSRRFAEGPGALPESALVTPAEPAVLDQSLINKAYRKAREAGDDALNARLRVLADLRVTEAEAIAAARAYGDEGDEQ